MLPTRGQRENQPQGDAPVNTSSSLMRGMMGLYQPQHSKLNLIAGGLGDLTIAGSATVRPSVSGLGYYGGSSSNYWVLPDIYARTHHGVGTGEVTLIAIVKSNTTADQGFPFQTTDAGTTDHYPYAGVVYASTFSPARWASGVAFKVPITSQHVLIVRSRVGEKNMYQNGLLVASGTGNTYSFNSGGIHVGKAQTSGFDGQIELVGVLDRYITDAEVALLRSPQAAYSELLAPQFIWMPEGAAASGSSGTVAVTNANDTSAATGTTTVTGTLAKTNGSDTSAASGTTTIIGTLAKSNADDTSAASGTVGSGVSGTVAYSNENDTSAATGTTTVTGTSAATNANDSAAASGWAGTVSGTVAVTNDNDTATASGVVTQPAGLTPQGGGGWLPKMRRKTRKELHAERVRLGILPPDVVKAAQKAAAVVLDEPSPVKAYRADPEAANKVFLRELGATKMLPDYTRAIQIQIEIMQQEDEDLMLFF